MQTFHVREQASLKRPCPVHFCNPTLEQCGQRILHFCHEVDTLICFDSFAKSFWHGIGVLLLMNPVLIGDVNRKINVAKHNTAHEQLVFFLCRFGPNVGVRHGVVSSDVFNNKC